MKPTLANTNEGLQIYFDEKGVFIQCALDCYHQLALFFDSISEFEKCVPGVSVDELDTCQFMSYYYESN